MSRSYFTAVPVLALLFVSAVGCGGASQAEKQLIGKWEMDTEHAMETMKAEMSQEGDEAEAQFGAALLTGLLSSMQMSITFTDDGKVEFFASAMGQSETKHGSWKVVSADGKNVTLEIAMDGKDPEPGQVTFIDKDTIELEPPGEQQGMMSPDARKMRMKRVKG